MWGTTQCRGSSISITRTAAVRRTSTARSTPSTTTAGVLSGLLLVLLGAAIAGAPSAAAVEDPTRPDARVTHGPSCRPGGLVVEVTGGSAPYFVRLATTRQPGGEDEATVAPGTTVVLRSDDVAWGETIDGRLEFEARDGSGATFVDELEHYSFTRPTEEDCAAVNDPTQVHPSPAPSAPDSAGQVPVGEGEGTTSAPDHTPTEPQETEAGAVPGGSGGAPAGQVPPGGAVTVDGSGFLPGEQVVVRLAGGPVLGTVTAGADGTVRTQVRIPEGTATGRTTLHLVGDDSAVVAGVDLQVAAVSAPTGDDGVGSVLPLVAAAGALVATAAGFVSVAGRTARRRPVDGSA
jgi:hypothetical protein